MQLQAVSFKGLPRWCGGVFVAMGLAASGLGWWLGAVQHLRLLSYLPVTGRIEESRVIDGGEHRHQPMIRYSYTVDGRSYAGQRVSAVGNYSQDGSWAWDIAAEFPAGRKVTVWYSARDPSSSFLLRGAQAATYGPHFAAILGYVFVLVGAWMLLQSFVSRRVFAAPERGRDGWFALRQEVSNRQAFRLWVVAVIAWYGYVGIIYGDYLVLSKGRVNILGIVAAVVVFSLGLPLLVQAWRFWKLLHDFTDARLSTDRQSMQTGSKVRLRLSQPVCRRIVVDELSLSAVCMRNDRITSGTSVGYAPAAVACRLQKRLAINREYSPGSEISVACELVLPPNAAPSTPPHSAIFPIFQWFIVLEVAARGQPALAIRFPVAVENGSAAQPIKIAYKA